MCTVSPLEIRLVCNNMSQKRYVQLHVHVHVTQYATMHTVQSRLSADQHKQIEFTCTCMYIVYTCMYLSINDKCGGEIALPHKTYTFIFK